MIYFCNKNKIKAFEELRYDHIFQYRRTRFLYILSWFFIGWVLFFITASWTAGWLQRHSFQYCFFFRKKVGKPFLPYFARCSMSQCDLCKQLTDRERAWTEAIQKKVDGQIRPWTGDVLNTEHWLTLLFSAQWFGTLKPSEPRVCHVSKLTPLKTKRRL